MERAYSFDYRLKLKSENSHIYAESQLALLVGFGNFLLFHPINEQLMK